MVPTERATNGVHASTPTLRILVADADADTRELYRRFFTLAGYEVVEAADGRDALTKALVRPPALVITEIRLPFIDGYALCEILRRDDATADVLILVVTAEARPAQVDRAQRAGADTVLIKPSRLDTILTETQRLLAHSRNLRESSAKTRADAGALVDRSAALLARSETHRRTALRQSHPHFTTTTPPASPPEFRCPSCDRRLAYQHSHIGGMSNRRPEQWDYYLCSTCSGTFQYRQRTRKFHREA